MKNIAVFGGTGGLGKEVSNLLKTEYNVISIGSKDVDVTDLIQVQNFFNQHDIDVVLNFSGVNYDCFMHKYDTENQAQIDRLIDVNIKGSTNILSSCLPKMRQKGYGRIVLISSILAEAPVISTGIYSGCKGFLDSMAKTVALENAGKGVTCNTIQLGYFDGGLTYKIPEDFRDSIKKSIPMKRFGSIEELKVVIDMFIKVEYISGISLKVNGGLDF